MDEIKWEDPPEVDGGRSRKWERALAPLRERPGQWANLGEQHDGAANYIQSGRCAGIAPGEFEAAMRRGSLYARYVGKQA